MNKKNVFSLILSIILFVSLSLSACYIIIEAHHDCTGEDCEICVLLEACAETINNLGSLLIISFTGFLIVSLIKNSFCEFYGVSFLPRSLVSLKVRIDS